MYEAIQSGLYEAVEKSQSPGAVLYVGDRENDYVWESVGLRQIEPSPLPTTNDTIYDLASLTKVFCTTPLVMKLRDSGDLRLEDSITRYVPVPAFKDMTLFHLLTHTSGLVPGNPYYETATTLEEMFQRYAVEGIVNPPGRLRSYSDVGFMLLGRMLEVISTQRLDELCREVILDPLNMANTTFNPPKDWKKRIAATETCPWRGRLMHGEVHDQNTHAVGGVAGQAGLFSNAGDIALFIRALLDGRLVSKETLVEMTTMGKVPTYPWQGLGWLIDPWRSKKQGFLPGRAVFGHTGWTGTSVWVDRESGLFAILLGNTCHPSVETRDNATFRRMAYTPVARHFYPATTTTHTGLDRVYRQDYGSVSRKRLALLTNHASVDQFGRPIRDVFGLNLDVSLSVLYSPEHGLTGNVERGVAVGAQEDTLRVISLYGKQKEPSAEELSGIDLFVIDLQDIGARYYTYMATMRRALIACAKSKVRVLVLDRPNPLGGLALEGGIAQKVGSDVCCAPIPIRHGMTMGELAAFFAKTELEASGLRLEILPLDNWSPERYFDDCTLPWIPPSPNIPTPETALQYLGMCLLEGTNLNEGRGTETPFGVVGAPWLDAETLVAQIDAAERPGCVLTSTRYTPRSIPIKASSPRFQDEVCQGVFITVTDKEKFRPFTTTLALLSTIRRLHPDLFEWLPFFDTLAGGEDLRRKIQRGEPATEIVEGFASELRAFDEVRPRFYGERSSIEEGETLIRAHRL